MIPEQYLYNYAIWALLAVVMIAYVIYRLVTDQKSEGAKHFLYPFISNSSDGLVPSPKDRMGWLVYIAFTTVMLGFLVHFFLNEFGGGAPDYLLSIITVAFLLGVVGLGIIKLRRNASE